MTRCLHIDATDPNTIRVTQRPKETCELVLYTDRDEHGNPRTPHLKHAMLPMASGEFHLDSKDWIEAHKHTINSDNIGSWHWTIALLEDGVYEGQSTRRFKGTLHQTPVYLEVKDGAMERWHTHPQNAVAWLSEPLTNAQRADENAMTILRSLIAERNLPLIEKHLATLQDKERALAQEYAVASLGRITCAHLRHTGVQLEIVNAPSYPNITFEESQKRDAIELNRKVVFQAIPSILEHTHSLVQAAEERQDPHAKKRAMWMLQNTHRTLDALWIDLPFSLFTDSGDVVPLAFQDSKHTLIRSLEYGCDVLLHKDSLPQEIRTLLEEYQKLR